MTQREQLIHEINQLSEAEIQELLNYVERMRSRSLPSDYDPENDPIIGLIGDVGIPDLAENVEEILEYGIEAYKQKYEMRDRA